MFRHMIFILRCHAKVWVNALVKEVNPETMIEADTKPILKDSSLSLLFKNVYNNLIHFIYKQEKNHQILWKEWIIYNFLH